MCKSDAVARLHCVLALPPHVPTKFVNRTLYDVVT
jgi:hypothetical protein